ncbi:hypothetical protein Efla_007222 [Eimeria flavescens]
MMRWLAAVCLGLAYILSVSAASKEIASAGSNGRYQADEGAARIRIEAPPSVQPAGGLLRAHSQLINSNKRRNQHGHLAKQPQAVLTGHAPTAGIPGLGGTDALETQEDGIQSASSQLSLSQETAPKAHNSSARPAGNNSSFSFVEKSESSLAILVLVGTCFMLCLIVAGILTYYALSMQAHARKGEERDSNQPYDAFQEANQHGSEQHTKTYQTRPSGAPQASLESFNSLYNLPPGFIERKTPREVEYERRVMGKMLSRSDAPPTPRAQMRHLNANIASSD